MNWSVIVPLSISSSARPNILLSSAVTMSEAKSFVLKPKIIQKTTQHQNLTLVRS